MVARLPKSRSHFHVLVDVDHYVRRYEPSDWSKQRAQRAGHVLASKGSTTIYTTTLNSSTQNSGDSVIPSQRRRKEVGGGLITRCAPECMFSRLHVGSVRAAVKADNRKWRDLNAFSHVCVTTQAFCRENSCSQHGMMEAFCTQRTSACSIPPIVPAGYFGGCCPRRGPRRCPWRCRRRSRPRS